MTFHFVYPPPKVGNILTAFNHYGKKCYFLVLDVSSKVKFGQGRADARPVYYALKLYSLTENRLFSGRWHNGANIEWVNESLTEPSVLSECCHEPLSDVGKAR